MLGPQYVVTAGTSRRAQSQRQRLITPHPGKTSQYIVLGGLPRAQTPRSYAINTLSSFLLPTHILRGEKK
eukprot:scaffold12861_cov134-Isochrysis_galbana.AAC.5